MLGGVVIANHGDGGVSAGTNDQETADPDVMGEEPDLGGVIDRLVRIRRHRVHVLSNDDAHRTADGEVDRQLGMPGIGHEVVKTVVTVGGREQQGITLLAFVDLLDGVTDAPVGPVHVTGNDEHHGDRHMVVGDVGHPEASRHRIQTTLEGEEIAVGSPVAGEEGTDTSTEAGIQLRQQVLIEELVGQRNVCSRSDGLAVQHQRLAGIDGIHQLGDRGRHVDDVTSPGQ